MYFQDDIRVTNRLTVNAGLRWDVYVPWIEVDNKQSNFDVSTGRFVVASDNATINGVEVGRYLQTYSRRDFGPRLGFAYDLQGDGRTIIRGGYGLFWNFTPGGTSSSKAQNQPFLQAQAITTSLGTNILLQNGLDPAPGVHPELAPSGSTRSAFLTDFRDAHAHNFNVNVQRQLGTNYMVEAAYSGSRTKDAALKVDLNQAPPTVGVNDQNVNRPFAKVSPALRTVGALSSTGYVEYNGLLVKFQRRSANHISFMNSYTLRSRHRPELGQRWHRHADRHLPSRVQPRTGRLRRDAHLQLELDLRAAVGGAAAVGRLAGERHPVPALGPADHHHAVAEHALDRPHEQPAEHHLRSGGEQPDDRRSSSTPPASSRWPTPPARSATPAATRFADRGSSTSTLGDQEHEDRAGALGAAARGVQPAEPSAVREPERAARQLGVRHDLGDAGEPVVRAVRHDRASDAGGGES